MGDTIFVLKAIGTLGGVFIFASIVDYFIYNKLKKRILIKEEEKNNQQ